MKDASQLSIASSLKKLEDGSLTSRAYAEALIERCAAFEGLNAFVATDWRALRASADRIDASGKAGKGLGGIPLCLKDNINTGVLPTSAATGCLRHHVAKKAAPVAKALLDAGALLGGTGNMHELAFGITNNNAVTGAARNPWNQDMIPGGSSGGVAVAVSARLMPGGIGTDTGASVRLPAALCGVVGFRPTVGRYSSNGIVPISRTRDTAGPITRSVEDASLLDGIMAGRRRTHEAVDARGLRLGVPLSFFFENLDPAVAEAADAALRELRRSGAELIEADIPDVAGLNEAVSFPIALFEFMACFSEYLAENGLDISMRDACGEIGSPDVRAIFESQLGDQAIPEPAYRLAVDVDRPRLQAAYARYFSSHEVDAVIFPTAPLPARPIGEDETVSVNGERKPTFATFIRNTDPGSNAGIPGISLPCGLSPDGLPIGMELDGPSGSDDRLLAIAATVEAAFDFSERPGIA